MKGEREMYLWLIRSKKTLFFLQCPLNGYALLVTNPMHAAMHIAQQQQYPHGRWPHHLHYQCDENMFETAIWPI